MTNWICECSNAIAILSRVHLLCSMLMYIHNIICFLFIAFRSSVVMVNVEDDDGEEIEENDMDCEGEETPPWTFYGDEDIDCDEDIDDQEDTALLRVSAAKTEIVITPMSPVKLCHFVIIIILTFL